MIRIIFFSTSNQSLALLQSLHEHFTVKLIVTRPDKPVGKKKILTPTAAKQFAQKHNILYISPTSLHSPKIVEQIVSVHPTLAVVADYGLMIPKNIFTIPAFQTLNVHFSKLPQYQGSSPVQYAILNGDKSAWITFFVMAEKLDSGPIVYQKEVKLEGNETTGGLYKDLFEQTARIVSTVIRDYIEGKLPPKPQRKNRQTDKPTNKISRSDGFIPWTLLKAAVKGKKVSKKDIELIPAFNHLTIKPFDHFPTFLNRALRAFSPWPGIWTEIEINGQKKRLKILEITPLMYAKRSSDGETTQASFQIKTVQLAGKSPVPWKQFLDGYPEVTKEFSNH